MAKAKINIQDQFLNNLRREKADEANAVERQTWNAWAKMWSRPSLYRTSIAAARSGRWALPNGLVPVMRGRKPPDGRGSGNLRKQLRDGKI